MMRWFITNHKAATGEVMQGECRHRPDLRVRYTRALNQP